MARPAAGSLSEPSDTDVLAYMLSRYGFAAGSVPLVNTPATLAAPPIPAVPFVTKLPAPEFVAGEPGAAITGRLVHDVRSRGQCEVGGG